MKKYLLLFTFILSFVQAQNKSITGKIIIDGEVELISFDKINIHNLTSDAKTTSNSNGIFSIKVNLNDELIFKDGGIDERTLRITESILDKGFITIHLAVEVIELNEAKVFTLNKDMLKNIGKEKSFQEKMNDKMGVVTNDFKAKLNLKETETSVRRTISEVGGLSVIGLFKTITGAHKKIKPLPNIQKSKQDQIDDLKRFYTENYFVEDLKIPKGKVTDFIDYCYMKYNFRKLLNENNYDEILRVIEEQALKYLTQLNLDK